MLVCDQTRYPLINYLFILSIKEQIIVLYKKNSSRLALQLFFEKSLANLSALAQLNNRPHSCMN